jgi:putative PIN family toxin of toxin-antitoxin system
VVKLVTDTNVVVSGLLWLGTPGQLLEAAAAGQVALYTSPALIAELSATLSYDKLAQRVLHSGLTQHELLQRYLNVAILVQPTAVPHVIPNDPDDDHVLACALAARANLIVSGDRTHLLPLGSYEGIPVVTPTEALRRIEMPA